MARLALRIWSVIISAIAVMAANSPTNATISNGNSELGGAITDKRSKKPELFLEKAATSADQKVMIAGHSSHRSHASHRSHYSGYSSSSSSGVNNSSVPNPYEQNSSTSVGDNSSKAVSNPTPTPSSNAVPSGSNGPSSNAPQKIIPEAQTSARPMVEVNKIVLKDGTTLSCDFAWKDGSDKITALVGGKTLKFNANEIDMKKTFGE